MVRLAGALSEKGGPEKFARLDALRKKLLQEDTVPLPVPRRVRLKFGSIGRTVVQVLANAAGPMTVSEIHQEVESLLRQAVNPRTVRSYLSEWADGPAPKFQRIAHGRYQLRSSA